MKVIKRYKFPVIRKLLGVQYTGLTLLHVTYERC